MNVKLASSIIAALCVFPMQGVLAGTEGTDNTFYGTGAGASDGQASNGNTDIGANAGASTINGGRNTFVGESAGQSNVNGQDNTMLGWGSGAFKNGQRNTFLGSGTGGNLNNGGGGNVFIGYGAGTGQTGSNRLNISTCQSTLPCTTPPLVYGEFDNAVFTVNGVANFTDNNQLKSQLHFSRDGGDYGGFLTSALQNNFFMSSGTKFDAGVTGSWIQLSADGRAVAAGSGSLGYRIFTASNHAVGEAFDLTSSVRLFINYDGEFGINGAPVAGHEIHTATGAYEMAGSWVDASSRDLKDNIVSLSNEDAAKALAELNPVRYNYKVTPEEAHVGFIAEDVPDLVARKDRKGLAPMDIVAVLTKVVQEKSKVMEDQQKMLESLAATVTQLQDELKQIKSSAQK